LEAISKWVASNEPFGFSLWQKGLATLRAAFVEKDPEGVEPEGHYSA
jgi:hypothetical protein